MSCLEYEVLSASTTQFCDIKKTRDELLGSLRSSVQCNYYLQGECIEKLENYVHLFRTLASFHIFRTGNPYLYNVKTPDINEIIGSDHIIKALPDFLI